MRPRRALSGKRTVVPLGPTELRAIADRAPSDRARTNNAW